MLDWGQRDVPASGARVPRAACCPCLVTRRFQAVKIGSCRSYAATRWYEDLTLPKTQSLPATIP